MPRAKKQTGAATPPAAGVAPPPPVPGGVGGPPPMPPGGFNPGAAPQPPAPPQGFPGGPPPGPSFPPLGQMQHPVPGANVAPPQPPAPGAFTPPAPQPMVAPQPLPPAPSPAPQGGADLGPVLAKLEDLGASVTKSLAGVDGKVEKAVAAGLKPIGDKVTELFSLMQSLYNLMMNNGPSQEQVTAHQQEQQQAAPQAAPAQPAGGLDKATADQLVGSLRAYKGYDAGQLAQHFAASYQQQGFPQLTAEVIYNVAGQAGLIGADGKIQ